MTAAQIVKTIILADDDAHIRELVRATLEEPEYRLLEAAGGQEAIELVRTEAPDLLILDWMMPGVSGIEALQEISRGPTMPRVLMLTARRKQEDVALATGLGARQYLRKPFSPLELIDKVREILQ